MKMYTRVCNDMRGINDFANENGISKEDIVDIFQCKDGTYIMVYYAEED